MSNIKKILGTLRNPVIDDEKSEDLIPYIYFKSTKYVLTAGAEESSQTSEKSSFADPLCKQVLVVNHAWNHMLVVYYVWETEYSVCTKKPKLHKNN